jgi:hypothetical protein
MVIASTNNSNNLESSTSKVSKEEVNPESLESPRFNILKTESENSMKIKEHDKFRRLASISI